MNLAGYRRNELLYIGFNQDGTCFACGTQDGYRIYSCDPFQEMHVRTFGNGGLGYVGMLFRSNVLALVGGGVEPVFPTHRVMIWDDKEDRTMGQLHFRSDVEATKLAENRVAVVLYNSVQVYDLTDLKLVDGIETAENTFGLCCMTFDGNIVAVPAKQKGHIRIELYARKVTTIIPAHTHDISCLALSQDGAYVASCSVKGTLIRIYDTVSGALCQELRRGTVETKIYALAFSSDAKFIACSSSSGTVHLFAVRSHFPKEMSPSTASPNKTIESLHHVESILPRYFQSEWSFASFKMAQNTPSTLSFGTAPNTLFGTLSNVSHNVVLSADGFLSKLHFGTAAHDSLRLVDRHRFAGPSTKRQ